MPQPTGEGEPGASAEGRRLPDGRRDRVGLPYVSMSTLPEGLTCHYCA